VSGMELGAGATRLNDTDVAAALCHAEAAGQGKGTNSGLTTSLYCMEERQDVCGALPKGPGLGVKGDFPDEVT
jgi:hypothetical protein